MVFRNGINTRIDSLEHDITTAREQAEQGLRDLRSSVDTLHAGVDRELHEGLREVRGLNQTLRQDGDRRAKAWQEQLEACREEIRGLHEQLRQEATIHVAPAPAPQPATTAPDVTADDETVPMETLFTTLTAAAAISVVEIACHPHTWAFVLRLARTRAQVFDLPEADANDGDGPATVRLSGPALMGVLNALHQARYDHPGDRLKREYIKEKALAHALFARISTALEGLRPREADSQMPRIVLDDARASIAPQPEPDDLTDEPELAEAAGTEEPLPWPGHPEPNYFLIGGKLMTVPHPLTCVTATTKDLRCKTAIEVGVEGAYVTDPATGIEAYDVGDSERWLAQRCKRHFGQPVPDFVPPQWRLYAPGTDTP
jgi:hypothetical protein